jgi:membrane dipeptidase
MTSSFSRRQFLHGATLAAATPLLGLHTLNAFAASTGSQTWDGYANATVIDGLGGPGRSTGKEGPALDAKDIADLRASGLTAVNLTIGSVGSYARNYEEAISSIAFWDGEVARHADVLLKFSRASDIEEARRSRRLALIYGFQDTTMLAEDIERLDTFHALGVRIVQLTYNRRNLVGDGCMETGNAGLSQFGREVVERMNTHDMLVDLSHCGQRTTDESIALSKKPVAITHAGCSAVTDHPRNKSDDTLRKLADKGGVAGIYLMPYLRRSGQPMAVDVIAHVEHALKVCGEDHVGIGTDNMIGALELSEDFKQGFAAEIARRKASGIAAPGEHPDVYAYVPDLNTPRRFETLAALLSARGHSDRVVGKVIGGNFQRLFAQTWPDA